MFLWESLGSVKDENTSEIISAQNQAFKNKISWNTDIKTESKTTTEKRQEIDDTEQHILSAYTSL
jgi:hypothetical protein